MEEQLITFKTARLAKEKGFDWEVLKAYDAVPMICSHSKSTFKPLNYNSPSGGNYHSAPTQSLLQKWLREIHNLDVQSYLIEMLFNEVQQKQDLYQREYTYRIYKEGEDMYVKLEEGLSYEQALEKGLYKVLKLLKKQ